MLPGWAVVATEPRLESIAVAELLRSDYQVFYPKIVKRIRKDGRRVEIVLPLFPGYLFVWLEKYFESIFGTRGVRGLLMSAMGNVATVREEAMKNLKSRCNSNGIYREEIKPKFLPGQKVLVSWGLLAGETGIFECVRSKEEIALFKVLGTQRRVA